MVDSYKSPPKKADFNRLQTSILSGSQGESGNPALEGTKQRLRDEMHLKKLQTFDLSLAKAESAGPSYQEHAARARFRGEPLKGQSYLDEM